MASSTSSSVSRYRPAVLAVIGAAAAYAVYTLISIGPTSAPSDSLRRRNAVRRQNRRQPVVGHPSHVIDHLQQHAQPLGDFDFFGVTLVLDPTDVPPPPVLRDMAANVEPTASPELVDNQINQLYDTMLDRFLSSTYASRPLTSAERIAVSRWLSPNLPRGDTFSQALARHSQRFGVQEVGGVPGNDGADNDGVESVAGTELTWDEFSGDDAHDADGQTLQRTLYHIAEERARHEGVVHRGITCNGCDTKPIRGIRWRCANCADFDLCSDCEATNLHIKTHIFYKIRVPAPYVGVSKQEPVYPGRPHVMTHSINSTLRKRLVDETKMEVEEVEALWDQFTCLAGTEWDQDPNGIGWALDRRAFNHAFIPRYSTFISAPNLIYDRIFAYYDTDHNGMIGFEEFVKGLDGMHSHDNNVKFRIVFNGYDIDGDGYISRKDVLRIFRAYYAIEKEATRNYLAEAADEISVRGALETIHSSQPLGSAFTQNSIPAHNPSNPRLHGKGSDGHSYAQPLENDTEDTADREEIIRIANPALIDTTIRRDAGDSAVRDRWARRQFYVDEEEGLSRPPGIQETPSIEDAGIHSNGVAESPASPVQERPSVSRSSSRVRFQDDVDIETRSNASTSSRPVGERWGGYEIPEPEKDLGKEILYQITQQAFNELLNPLFQEKEDNAMDVFSTRVERRKRAEQIDAATDEFKREEALNKAFIYVGMSKYAKWVVNRVIGPSPIVTALLEDIKHARLGRKALNDKLSLMISAAEQEILDRAQSWPADWKPPPLDLWNAKLCRMQLRNELRSAVAEMATHVDWLSWPPSRRNSSGDLLPPEDLTNGCTTACDKVYRDPTMPQFRPNTVTDDSATQILNEATASVSEAETSGSDSSSDRVSMADSDIDERTYHILPYEPFFVIQQIMDDSSSDASAPASPSIASNPAPAGTTNESQPPPPPPSTHCQCHHEHDPSHDSTLTTPSDSLLPPLVNFDPHEETNDPVVFIVWIDTDNMTIVIERRRASYASAYEQDTSYKPFERKLRRMILNNDEHPLYHIALASLEAVEAEINERKGSGLISYEEWDEKMQEGRLRFLQSWMDWMRRLAVGCKLEPRVVTVAVTVGSSSDWTSD